MRKIIYILFIGLVFTSCEENSVDQITADNAGDWSGTYSGDSMGTWQMTITEDGDVNGTAILDNTSFVISGGVEPDGSIIVNNALIELEFIGSLMDQKASGTWQTPNSSGSWDGIKDN